MGAADLLLLALTRTPQPETVKGTVVDAGSMTPLSGVEVAWKSRKVISDIRGRYEIQLPAGARQVSFTAPNHPVIKKLLILKQGGTRVNNDALLPSSSGGMPKVLALDRGSLVSQQGRKWEPDVSADSPISLADEYGNEDQLLTLNMGSGRVHSPVWRNASTILFGREALVHHPGNSGYLGVFQFQYESSRIQQVSSGIGIHFLSKSPQRDMLAGADQKSLYVLESLSSNAGLHRIFSLPANKGFLLSVAWGPDDRIYFTVDDSVPLDDRHYLSKSRIASIKIDGTDLQTDWASEARYSYRYPMAAGLEEMMFGRFALDGSRQELWIRNTRTGKMQLLAEPALRAVYLNSVAKRLYYIYQQELHLRDLHSGADWVIVNSVREADYLRSVE